MVPVLALCSPSPSSMSALTSFVSLYSWVRQNPWMRAFTVLTRVGLAIGFVGPGLQKVLGHRFHNPEILTPETTLGAFFEAFFQAPEFYAFVGAAQVVAGLLLLHPRTALLGALVFLPIIANIFAITVALPFGGTVYITGAMLLAAIYLLAWDAPRLFLLVRGSGTVSLQPPLSYIRGMADRVAFALLLGSGLLFTVSARGYFGPESALLMLAAILVGSAGGCLYLFMTWSHRVRTPA